MTDRYEAIIRQASRPLKPIPPSVEPRWSPLPAVRAVLFDIYGTLLVSASGDIGSMDAEARATALVTALKAVGLEYSGSGVEGASRLRQVIEADHAARRALGVDYPEVDIVEIWRETCSLFHASGQLRQLPEDTDYRRLAVEFETRVNPIWPMPGLLECLASLRQRGPVMGIISNAQFFTPLAFPALVGQSLDQLGFAPRLRYYSYEHGCAKPGPKLYGMAAQDLAENEILPSQVLYVGNDMRNDIGPAAEVGFRTALFAGDRRSLRLRTEDAARDRCGQPDAIVTHLKQIPTILAAAGGAR